MDEQREDGSSSSYLVKDLQRRVILLEEKVSSIERTVLTNTIKIAEGLTGGASKEFTEIHRLIRDMQRDLTMLDHKTTRWEGGGAMIYLIIVLFGGVVGWAASHIAGFK